MRLAAGIIEASHRIGGQLHRLRPATVVVGDFTMPTRPLLHFANHSVKGAANLTAWLIEIPARRPIRNLNADGAQRTNPAFGGEVAAIRTEMKATVRHCRPPSFSEVWLAILSAAWRRPAAAPCDCSRSSPPGKPA